MGQRLVIKMIDNSDNENVALATGYYHWSGYTDSSFYMLKEIIEEYLENKEEYNKDNFKDHKLNNLFKAIKLLESTGAGFEDLQKVKELFDGYDFNGYSSRNEGIIDISEEGMTCALDWAEALVEINLDSETISFQAFGTWDIKDYYDNDISWNFEQVDNESDYREDDIKRINNYFEEDLITEETKEECLRNIDNGKHLTFVDPIEIDEPFDFYNFSFEDIDLADEVLESIKEEGSYSFIMPGTSEGILTLIE